MPAALKIFVVLGLLVGLAGCNAFGPAGPGDSVSSVSTPSGTVTGAELGGLQLGTTDFVPPGVTRGPSTGTAVGGRVSQLQEELDQLQSSILTTNDQLQVIRQASITATQRYYGLISAINARLQVGTTPGNPVLVSQLGQAQGVLDGFGAQVAQMTDLSNGTASSASVANFLTDSVRATYGLTGAVEADHRYLTILEDEVEQTDVLIDRLMIEMNEDLSRQSGFLASEQSNLQALQASIANGRLYGYSLANRPFSYTPGQSVAAAAGGALESEAVVIFDRSSVDFGQPLYNWVNQWLNSRPGARFQVVGVSPAAGTPSERALAENEARSRAQEVIQTLVGLGLPGDRLSLAAQSSAGANFTEVHVLAQ